MMPISRICAGATSAQRERPGAVSSLRSGVADPPLSLMAPARKARGLVRYARAAASASAPWANSVGAPPEWTNTTRSLGLAAPASGADLRDHARPSPCRCRRGRAPAPRCAPPARWRRPSAAWRRRSPAERVSRRVRPPLGRRACRGRAVPPPRWRGARSMGRRNAAGVWAQMPTTRARAPRCFRPSSVPAIVRPELATRYDRGGHRCPRARHCATSSSARLTVPAAPSAPVRPGRCSTCGRRPAARSRGDDRVQPCGDGGIVRHPAWR